MAWQTSSGYNQRSRVEPALGVTQCHETTALRNTIMKFSTILAIALTNPSHLRRLKGARAADGHLSLI